MGMFDEIQCKVPLPAEKGVKSAAEWKNHTFQTKDLHSAMLHFEIRKSGLWVKEVKYKELDIEGWKKKKKKRGVWDFPTLEVESEKWVKENFTGYVNFYDMLHDIDDDHDVWVEFRAHFQEGRLVDKVELIEWRLENNSDRKASEKKWKDEVKARKKFQEKWYYKYFGQYWNMFIGTIFNWGSRFLGWVSDLFQSLRSFSWKVERWFKF
tara:strand:- start:22706 stop:23332 length:627 start_codon:yes stop_codon:yes gene_type:complete